MTTEAYIIGCFGTLIASAALLARPWKQGYGLAFIGVIASLAFSLLALQGHEPSVILAEPIWEWIRITPITPYWCVGVLIALLCGAVLEHFDSESRSTRTPNLLLLVISGLGALSLAVTSNLIVALCAWEVAALPLTLATTLDRSETQKPAMTFFLADFFSFILMALGITLIFAQFQTLSLETLLEAVQSESHSSDILLYTGIALTLSGLMTRLGVLPFQGVLYERVSSGPLALAGFAGLFLPMGAAAFAWRLMGEALHPTLPQWQDFLSALGLLTLWAGSLGMLVQSSWRRFVAHALIAQGGWVLMALVSTGADLEAEVFLLVFSNSLALAVITFGAVFLKRNGGTQAAELSKGLLQQRPGIAFAMITGYLTLAGVPPTAGFAARAQLLFAQATGGRISMAVFASLSIAVAAYPCLRRLSPLLDATPVTREWVRPAKRETLFFCGIALILWMLGILPAIGWRG